MGGIIMNENLDLTKILEGCPIGTKLYSTIFGNVSLKEIVSDREYPIIISQGIKTIPITKEGKYILYYDGECTLFPDKDQRDWGKFERFWDKPKVNKFDPKTFHPFDKVLAKDGFASKWTCSFFSHMDNDVSFPVYCSGGYFKVCIPFNEETKHLVGTRNDCPEYYKWWEK